MLLLGGLCSFFECVGVRGGNLGVGSRQETMGWKYEI